MKDRIFIAGRNLYRVTYGFPETNAGHFTKLIVADNIQEAISEVGINNLIDITTVETDISMVITRE